MSLRSALLQALEDRYNAQISEADATIQIYLEKPVAIGEHPQHLDEIDKLITKIAEAALKTAKDSFDFAKDARDAMTTEGYSNFVAEVKDTIGVNITDPTNMEEYLGIAEIYNSYATDANNLKDAFRDKVYTTSLDVFLSEAQDIQALLAGLEEDPTKRSEQLAVLVERLMTLNIQAAQVSNFGRGEDYQP